MRRVATLVVCALLVMAVALPSMVSAQASNPVFTLSTPYPSQQRGIDDDITFGLTIRTAEPILAKIEMAEIPNGWTATFKGGGNLVNAVFADSETDGTVQLILVPPEGAKAGNYHFLVRASAGGRVSELPIDIQLRDRAADALSFSVDFPKLTSRPGAIMRYNLTLRNDGDDAVTVNLAAETPPTFQTTLKASGQEVNSVPLEAGASTIVNVELRSFADCPAGEYSVLVRAVAGKAEAQQVIQANITGEPSLTLTAPDGVLSGRAYAGSPANFTVLVRNAGSAPARNVRMSSTPPTGWSVTFEPQVVGDINIGQEMTVIARIEPAEKAVAGDYMVNLAARAEGTDAKTIDFRITVLTSTMWGMAGVGLIALAVGVLGLAVFRFGRR